MIDLSSLKAICDMDASQTLREQLSRQGVPMPPTYLVGRLGNASFVATQCDDGQTEVSLCDLEGRVSPTQVKAFFRKIGQPIPDAPATKINKGHGLHWVLDPGAAT